MESLEQQVVAFQTSLEAKDSVVMAMADELDAYKNNTHLREANPDSSASSRALDVKPASTTAVNDLSDVIAAYKLQNSLLNSEILELNRLRESGDVIARDTMQTCVRLEMCYYDVHRKYVQCLAELGKREDNSQF